MYQYKYIPKNIVVTVDKKEYKLADKNVVYLSIAHNYTQRRLPIIFLQIEMDDELLALIYANPDTVLLKMDIVENQVRANDNEIMNSTLFLQKTFNIIPRNVENMYNTSQQSLLFHRIGFQNTTLPF